MCSFLKKKNKKQEASHVSHLNHNINRCELGVKSSLTNPKSIQLHAFIFLIKLP
jgi:hypothetical protein